MAWTSGTATDYKDLLAKVVDYISAKGTSAAPSYTGTGNGTLNDFVALEQTPTETWTLSCSNATKVGVANYSTTIATDTPVLHWRMNAVSGTVEQDTTANNLDGTIAGTPTLASTSLLSVDTDKSMTFDGVDDNVKSGISALLQTPDADCSLEVVIKPTSLTGLQYIVSIGESGETIDTNYLISLQLDEGYLKMYHEYGLGIDISRTSDIKLNVNETYHIVLANVALTNTYYLYLDGVLVYTWPYLYPSSDGTNSVLVVGSDVDNANLFTGVIDEVAFYSSELSAATALTHAKAAVGHETFTVTGSVSGAQLSSFAGLHYINDYVSFRILDGATDFIVSDNWTIAVTIGDLGTQGWEILRKEKDHLAMVKGKGLAGSDQIFVNMETYFDESADYYNMRLNGADGYDATETIANQLNNSPTVYVPLIDTAISYWIVASGRRFIVIAKTSTNFHGCYCGFFLPFATPTQYPQPLVIGGSSATSTARWSNTTAQTTGFFDPYDGVKIRKTNGAWASVRNGGGEVVFHPYSASDEGASGHRAHNIRTDLAGNYLLMPITVVLTTVGSATEYGILGELDQCYFVSGFSNAAENIVNDGVYDHLVVQSAYKTGVGDYLALRLD